ncbi:MAG: Rieske 2Fe-2S domain-containing protein, partial [Planctomycetes bacterium]|nr:Rieske 2Fe-2S domain-containing protein [Planctomycetota bacterium]
MTTESRPPDEKPSRLDPEAMPRRDFLGIAATTMAAGACGFALLGAARLPKAAVLPSASKKFKVTLPETLLPGEPFFPPGRSVAIYKDGKKVHAVSTICTHLGCIVKPSASGFDCPCHGSKFRPDGSVLRGPAPKALVWLSVKGAGGNAIMIDEGTIVP